MGSRVDRVIVPTRLEACQVIATADGEINDSIRITFELDSILMNSVNDATIAICQSCICESVLNLQPVSNDDDLNRHRQSEIQLHRKVGIYVAMVRWC